MLPSTKLKQLGLVLPPVPTPQGAYMPWRLSGNLVFLSGALPIQDGVVMAGKAGTDLTLEQCQAAAKLCILNLLAGLEKNGLPLDRVKQILKVTGYVQSAPDFWEQSKVINAASELLFDIFGDAGKHARAAVGVIALPLNAVVEIEAVIEVSI